MKLTILILTIFIAAAQGFTVSGQILKRDGDPGANATVYCIEDSANVTMTDAEGKFTLNANVSITALKSGSGIPNMAKGSLHFIWHTNSQAEVVLKGINNRIEISLRHTLKSGTNSINLPKKIPDGMYVLQILSENLNVALTTIKVNGNFSQANSRHNTGLSNLAKQSGGQCNLVTKLQYYRKKITVVQDGSTDVSITLEKLPNIVLLLSDDQSWTDYGFMGHDTVLTPNLDKLAGESLLFTRGYTAISVCRPSLMTLSTGLYPHQHQVFSNDPPEGAGATVEQREQMLKHIDRLPTVQKLLRDEQGYVSLRTGKWWEGSWERGHFTHGMTNGSRHGDIGLNIGRTGLGPIPDFIDEAGERPFYLWYAPFLPHKPHDPPQRLLDKYLPKTPDEDLAKYWAMVEWFDETCGQVVDLLEEKGVMDNTLIYYVGDNGWLIGEAEFGVDVTRSKQSPYEMGVRQPTFIRWPGKVMPGRDDASLVSTIDYMPTILAAADIKPPTGLPGFNLLHDTSGWQEREAIFGENYYEPMMVLDEPQSSIRYQWVIEGWWKLIVPIHEHEIEPNPSAWTRHPLEPGPVLFNLETDPHETNDLAEINPGTVNRLLGVIADSPWTLKL